MTRTTLNAGTLLTFAPPFALPDEIKAGILDKWEAANDEGDVDDLLAEAEGLACPKAYIRPAKVEAWDETGVTLGGVRFEGTLLSEKLRPHFESGEVVYLYTATCGRELHEWAAACDDILLRSAADDICIAYLRMGMGAMREIAAGEFFGGKHFSAMNPGSLPSWNLRGQIPMFEFLGEGAVQCGVSLTDSLLMVPFKSSSGLYFPTEHNFESCMFCDKLDCPNRRAPFLMNKAADAE